MGRSIDAEELMKFLQLYGEKWPVISVERVFRAIQDTASSAPAEVVRCKDCKHRPIMPVGGKFVQDLDFPDGVCPLQCGDPWYNMEPDDEWFCANGSK